jgi:hypothetical protein
MCWITVETKLAYMLGHCWNSQQFEAMKENFPKTEILVRYANGSNAKICLADMEYNASCIRVVDKRILTAESTDRVPRKPASPEMG